MKHEPLITIKHAEVGEDWAVRRMFQALHEFNASLDARFALAEGWERLLDEHLAHVRERDSGLTLLAWQANHPLGLLMMGSHTDSPLFRHRHWIELYAIYVMPEARGGDLARRLLHKGVAWARHRDYDRIQLYVTASNAAAQRFYANNGFKPVQEIWRLELHDPDDSTPLPAGSYDILSMSTNQLDIDEDTGEASVKREA